MDIISLSSTVIMAITGSQDSPAVTNTDESHCTDIMQLERAYADSRDVKTSCTAYLPPVNLHKVFEGFHKTQFYADVYKGKSLGEFIRVED